MFHFMKIQKCFPKQYGASILPPMPPSIRLQCLALNKTVSNLTGPTSKVETSCNEKKNVFTQLTFFTQHFSTMCSPLA